MRTGLVSTRRSKELGRADSDKGKESSLDISK